MRPWVVPDEIHVSEDLLALVGGSSIAAKLLVRRGLENLDVARGFLDPDCYDPAPPEALPGIRQAMERIQTALGRAEHILVWGDFDVDGQTATALLVETMRDLGGRVSYHIPVRAVESHGVSRNALHSLLESAQPTIDLMLTCDTGIAAFDALDYARERGLDVIITDHHELPQPDQERANGSGEACLPPALAVLTPRLLPKDHPLAGLPGVGVAYKLCEALYAMRGERDLARKHLDLVALGIVADVARQTGDTRYLLQLGLRLLRQTRRIGLQAIYERADLVAENLSEEQVGFILAPRLNALGRLGDANPAVELLTTSDISRARILALELEGLNAQRQLLTSQVLGAALSQLENDRELSARPVLILSHPNWEPGVIGIVASRLVELYGKPAVLISNPPGEPARASARSIEGLDITAAIGTQREILIGYGGHAMAAGFSISNENVPLFTSRLTKEIGDRMGEMTSELPGLQIDEIVEWNELDIHLAEMLEKLSPFGAGNPAPIFVTHRLRCTNQSNFGRQAEHVQLLFEDVHGDSRRVVWWGGGEVESPDLMAGEPLDLAYTLRRSNYRGEPGLSITYVDSKPSKTQSEMKAGQPAVRVIDYRKVPQPLSRLVDVVREYSELDVQIWVEGENISRLVQVFERNQNDHLSRSLRGRNQLDRCRTLIVWTAPCGNAEYKKAIKAVNPSEIVLFGVDPGASELKPFLTRLSGLVKGLLVSQQQLDLPELAAALAQRESTVQLGLNWLEAMGYVSIELITPDSGDGMQEYRISSGGPGSPEAAKMLITEMENMLEEARAYRSYFKRFSLQIDDN